MKRTEVLGKLLEIIRDIFDDASIEITEETTPDEIENWDSIGHIYLTVEIEDEFGITLDERMQNIENVSDIINLIEEAIG